MTSSEIHQQNLDQIHIGAIALPRPVISWQEMFIIYLNPRFHLDTETVAMILLTWEALVKWPKYKTTLDWALLIFEHEFPGESFLIGGAPDVLTAASMSIAVKKYEKIDYLKLLK